MKLRYEERVITWLYETCRFLSSRW